MKVGSLVECIDSSFSEQQIVKIKILPVKNKVYTIREIIEYPTLKRIGLLLEEIINPPIDTTQGVEEPSFDIKRFRELPEVDVEEMVNELFNVETV